MPEKPTFSKPESTEDLVHLYDYVYQESADSLPCSSQERDLAPYGSHTDRDRSHISMISKMTNWKDPSQYSVIDASCGRGHLLKNLIDLGYKAEGTEVSKYLMENDLKDLPVREATYDNIAEVCGEDSFDIVITNDVLEHLVDEAMVRRALRNLCKVSKKWLCLTIGIGEHCFAEKYPIALGLEMKGLHTFRREGEWWKRLLGEYLQEVNVGARRARIGSFYGKIK